MIIGFAPKVIVLAVHGRSLSQQLKRSSKAEADPHDEVWQTFRRVGRGAKRRAHHSFETRGEMVGTLRFAHPTKNYTSRLCAIAA
jgi:hypothetical protein